MKDAEISCHEKSNESDWSAAPLFARNVVPQINNLVPPFTDNLTSEKFDQSSLPPINVEPQKILASPHQLILSTNTDLETAKSVEPEQRGNSELSGKENVQSFGADQSVFQLQKKSRKKLPVKKILSQKRNVLPLKLFVSPAEKIALETSARERNCSLSNYIRLNLGLAPNEAGRKRQNVVAAFDLSELELDLD